MIQYVATFYTHFAALRSCKNLCAHQIEAHMAPVPRCLSTSCGTCLKYEADQPHKELMHEDYESIYRVSDDGKYSIVEHNE